MPITSPRASARSLPSVPLEWGSQQPSPFSTPEEQAGHLYEWVRMIAEAVRNILDGKILATGTVTLTAGSTTTTLSDRRIGPNSVILFMPTTANAATATGNLYVSARTNESATLTHTSNAQTDRSFSYAVLG